MGAMKPMSSIWSASSRTRISVPDSTTERCVEVIDQAAGRGDEDVDAAAHGVDLRTDAATPPYITATVRPVLRP